MSLSPVDPKGKGRALPSGTDSDATVTLMTSSSVTLSDDDGSSSSRSSDSTSDSSEDDSDDSASEEDSDDEDISHEYMTSLLEKAKQNARTKRLEREAGEVSFANDEDVIKFGGEAELYVQPTFSS
jgi:U3 small nucleolar RNA-associated protein 14